MNLWYFFGSGGFLDLNLNTSHHLAHSKGYLSQKAKCERLNSLEFPQSYFIRSFPPSRFRYGKKSLYLEKPVL